MVYADVRILVGRVFTVKKNTDALLVASKEVGLEANVDKRKYMVMYRSGVPRNFVGGEGGKQI